MSEFYKDYEITDDEANAVKIANLADRPNAFNSYRESKMSADDVKKKFDAPFLLVQRKFNEFLRKIASDKAASDKKIDKVYNDLESGKLNYNLTAADKREIAGILAKELDGNDIAYTGEEAG